MTTDVLPELALGGAELVRRTVEQPGAQCLTAAAVEGILRQSLLTLEFVCATRDELVQELQGHGLDPNIVRAACDVSLRALDALADANGRLLSLPLEAAQRQEAERQQTLAAAVRRSFAEWSEVLGRPLPPLDWKKLAEDSRADAAAGRMIRVEGFGDLFPLHPGEA